MSWSESRFVRPYISQLSPELVDLLNHVLHTDPDLVRACMLIFGTFILKLLVVAARVIAH